eukprot:317336-Rhodomonas_salina.2
MNRLWCYDQSFFSYKVCYAQTVANKTPYWMWDTLLLVGIQCSAKAPIFPCCRFPVPGTRRNFVRIAPQPSSDRAAQRQHWGFKLSASGRRSTDLAARRSST